MTLRLYDQDMTNLLIEKEYTDTESIVSECVTELNQPFGKGYYHEIYFENVHIGYGNALLSDKVLFHFESDFETVEMHFALKGKNTANAQHFSREIGFTGHQHNIIYANQLHGKMEWDCEELQLLEINLSPNFFKRYLPEDSGLLNHFRNAIDKQCSGLIMPHHNRISYKMYQLIDEIMNCNRKGLFKKMFLEAKVIELLLLQLEQFCDHSHRSAPIAKTEIEKMYAVKEYILMNLNETCSLIDLAHLVGTNEFSLKKGFKELFGTTVFGFWNDAKMEQAKKMLFEEQMNVSEVSDSIGYKNPRHFSAAFKRKYGIVPSQLKK